MAQKWRTERARKRTSSFLVNPFGFTKRLLGQKRSGRLDCSKAKVDNYLFNTLRDPNRGQELGHQRALLDIPAPLVEINTSEPTWKEVQEVVTSARASSAPGPSQLPYKVYRCCPNLLKILCNLLQVIWRRGTISD